MNDKKFFWTDEEIKNPSHNLAINRCLLEKIKNKELDFITRVYLHEKGVILGNSQSRADVNIPLCKELGYEIVNRPSGGSLIITKPDLTICYSIFFNLDLIGKKFDIEEIYKSITIPLAKNLGKDFIVKGTYYIRYRKNLQETPIAGHAIKYHSNAVQFDGVINNKSFEIDEICKLIKLRNLYKLGNQEIINIGNNFFDLNGKKIILNEKEKSNLKIIKSEKDELEKIIGLEEIGISRQKFNNTLLESLRQNFGTIKTIDYMILDDEEIKKYRIETLNGNNAKRKNLGHCFVDFMEKEPPLHYEFETFNKV